jgi:3-deoxy-D-manno-octulosonate 8-phosphate phosphatase KdsC-like HAD superfamily phosphatase
MYALMDRLIAIMVNEKNNQNTDGLAESANYETFILDVDGVITTGRFYYTESGKVMKVFGPDDNDGLSLLRPYLKIVFITGGGLKN